MTNAIPKNTIASSTDGKIVKSPWHESDPDRPKKAVKDTWKEQFALISALSEEPPVAENLEEGKVAPNPDNSLLIRMVKEMEGDGSLKKALDYLAAAHDAKKPINPGIIVQVAQLLCIMDDSVYMRDLKVEEKVKKIMEKHEKSVKSAMDKKEKLSSAVIEAIEDVSEQMDEITKKINEVAVAMGLEYVPLCNFSSYGTIRCNGPYCGAFYRKPLKGDNGLIVVAFKGTGTGAEWFNNARAKKMSASENSPLRGQCHTGFFKGMFSDFPSEISADGKVGKTIPFNLLKNQLWRLTTQTMVNTADRQVPVWITGHSLGGAYATHCWQGLLATSRLNAHDKSRTIRDLFTFGSPKVGDEEYARYPNAIKTFQNSWRFVNEGDVVAKVPPAGYHHVDRKVVISPQKIELRDNKLEPPEGAIGDVLGHLLGVAQHGLKSYWESLRNGAKRVQPGSWQESQRGVTPPPHANLATWSLEEHHPQEHVPSESHKDAVPAQESVLVGKDRRRVTEPEDYEENAKYRSVVKIQSMFTATNRSSPIWTMGTGWLIREDLVVTAGHNVYSNTYGGQAQRIKCWIGYRGRKHASAPGVQHRQALNIVTTASWRSNKSDRRRDVALIQVSTPFEGQLKLFRFINTDTKVTNQQMTVVGYPGDKSIKDENGNDDPGAEMWFHTESITFDLEKNGMIAYDIDTFGGQSGAPILLRTEKGLRGIGTHCYGAGGSSLLNSGNAIGGTNGNNYEDFKDCLFGSDPRHPTPIGTYIPNMHGKPGPDPDDDESLPEGEESFWDIFKTVAKIGSVALPTVGGILGPAGSMLGTVAGGILGSLSESEIQSDTPQNPSGLVQESCIHRAQLAEAALQCVTRLGHSSQSNEVFSRMEETWRQSYSQQIPQLAGFITPVLTEYGFLMTAENWEKKVEPNPEKRKLLQGDKGKVTLGPPQEGFEQNNKAKFVRAIFEGETRLLDDIPEEQESFSTWFKPLIEKAVLMAKPLATTVATSAFNAIIDKVTKSSGESFSPKDKPRKLFENIIRRAMMADCALQAIETMDGNELQQLKLCPTDSGDEEGILDSIKRRVQIIGPVAVDYAKSTVRKYLPMLLEQLTEKHDPAKKFNVNRTTLKSANFISPRSMKLPVSEFRPNGTPNGTVARSYEDDAYEDDDNPDAPPVEPRPPASPKE